MTEKLEKTEQEWREELSPERFHILREKGTEPPFTGAYTHSKIDGMYRCGACGAELFSSDSKFDSGTGWPSFTEPAVADAVELHPDNSHGMRSEERRVGKECRFRWAPDHEKKKRADGESDWGAVCG